MLRNLKLPLIAAVVGLLAGGCGGSGGRAWQPLLIFGHEGLDDGLFHMPREVGFAPDGKRLYILDRSHRVQVFDTDGLHRETWPTPPGQLGNPRGLDVAPDGTVFVADTHNSQLLVFTPGGKLTRTWGKPGKGPGEFISVTDVALDPEGNVWTCEYGGYNDRIQKFSPEGTPLLVAGMFGSRRGQFNRPQGIAFGPGNRVYVADAVNHRIQVLSLEGKVVDAWGEVGTAPGKLRYPYDVSFDGENRLYVAEFGNSRVSVFTPEGKYLTQFGRPGRENGEFDHPWGVNIAHNGEIYVSDTMNYRIQKFPPLPRQSQHASARTH